MNTSVLSSNVDESKPIIADEPTIEYHNDHSNNNGSSAAAHNDNNLVIVQDDVEKKQHENGAMNGENNDGDSSSSSSSSSSSTTTSKDAAVVNNDGGVASTDDVIVTVEEKESVESPRVNSPTSSPSTSAASSPSIPQYDGPSDENSGQPEMRTAIFEYVDEFGEVHSYEMAVNVDEYNRIMKEKEGKSNPSSSDNSGNRASSSNDAPPASAINPVNVSQQQLNTPAAVAGNSSAVMDDNYKIVMFGKVYNLFFDRRTLEYLFDRDSYPKLELIGSPLMAFGVAWMGLRLMALLDRNWASIVFMILALAQAHFSMLKSPQPEANSPFHYSKGTVYSRAFYVLFFGTIALICGVLTRVPEPM